VIDISETCTNPSGIIAGDLWYSFDGSVYTMPSFITPGLGYWILSLENGVLSVPCEDE
jgi:hypothetical protein